MLALLLAGCNPFQSGPVWSEQVSPGGPCYAFNLMDGVVAGDNAELHAAFECVNRQGAVEPLVGVDTSLDAATRSGNVGGQAVALIEGVGASDDLSFAGVLSQLLAAFDDRAGTKRWLGLAVEWTYSAHVDELGSAVPINSSASLDLGLVVPLLHTGAAVATAVLDDEQRAVPPLTRALRADDTRRWAWTLALLRDAPDDDLAKLAADWPGLVADVVDRTEDSTNDLVPGATGNSLRDATTALAGGDALVDVVAAAEPILSDVFTRDLLAAWIVDEGHAGRWAHLDSGLTYLASVDVNGGHLDAGEASALVSLVRLLHDGNQPVTCTIDLLITDVHVDLGNLAVALLEAIAAIDPDTVAGGVDILGDAIGYPLTDAVLSTVADSGVCPVINEQFISDLESVDRLSDPASEDLLRSLLGALAALDGHLDAVADTASALHEHRLVTPVQELLYDLGGTAALREPLAAIPALVDPDGRQASDEFPTGVRPVDLGVIVELLLAVGDADTWHTLAPLVDTTLAQESTWTALHNSHHLLTRSGTTTAELLDLLGERLAKDPDLAVLDALAEVLDDPALAGPALELVEDPTLGAAITKTELANVGPLPWLTELYVGGTVDQLWDTLALFRPLLGVDNG